jgi:hypothetical protein
MLCVAPWLGGTAAAQLVTFKFDGTVTAVDAPLGVQFSVGDTLIGTYTTDVATVDSDATSTGGEYLSPFTAFVTTFSNGYVATLNPGGPFTDTMILNDDPVDIYSLLASVTGPSVSGQTADRITVNLLANSAPSGLVTSDDLPTTPPNVALADINEGVLQFGSTTMRVTFSVRSIELVPEPATLWLMFAAALCGLPRRTVRRH